MSINSIPPPKKEEGLQNIIKLPPIKRCLWNVFAYALNRDMIKHNGQLDDLHAMVFMLGSFDTKEKADKHIEELTLKTGHSGFYRAYYGSPVPLTTKPDPITTSIINVDTKGQLIKLENDQYKRDKEVYDKHQKLELELKQEADLEDDVDHLEYFKRQFTVAIKNKVKLEAWKKELQTASDDYKKREIAVRKHYTKHPENEEKWLPYLKEKLTERGELNHYIQIEAGYKKYRNDILFDNADDLNEQIMEHQEAIKDLQNRLDKISQNKCLDKTEDK